MKFVVELSQLPLSEKDHKYVSTTFHTISDLERIGDYAENIMEYADTLKSENEGFSESAVVVRKAVTCIENLTGRLLFYEDIPYIFFDNGIMHDELEMKMEFANPNDLKEIMNLYERVIEKVNKTSVRLGWNTDIYPNVSLVNEAISNGEMCVLKEDGRIIAAAILNRTVNPEYDEIKWEICGPQERISTIHALAVSPDKQGERVSDNMLRDIEEACRKRGDLSIHLDVIDTNIPAYKLYTRNGYKEADCIKMYYEVVGTRDFWMLEHVL